MLGDIDLKKKPVDLELFLAKPNMTIIGKIKHHYRKRSVRKLGQINEITFDVPYEVDIRHNLVKTPLFDQIREGYLIKAKEGPVSEWYTIVNTKKRVEESGEEYKSVTAYSLAYELKDKIIRGLNVTSYNAEQILREALANTIWNIGYIDSDFIFMYRSFDVSESTVLEFVFEIAETFGALPIWDTEKRRIHLYNPKNIGLDKGFVIKDKKYLKALEDEIDYEEVCTRLRVYGKDGLSIQRVNPTGAPYLEDFSFYMYPFQRDENRNVISHSYYMSDDLCHAILDYQEKVEQKKGIFEGYIAQIESLEKTKTQLQTELFQLETELALIQDRYDVKYANAEMGVYEFVHNTSNYRIQEMLHKDKYYIVMLKAGTSNVNFRVNGTLRPITKVNDWFIVHRFTGADRLLIEVQGTPTYAPFHVIYLTVQYDEYNNLLNEAELIEKYNEPRKKDQVNAKKAEINNIDLQIDAVRSQIDALREELSIENNFTPEQIIERNMFIKEKVWEDQNYFNDVDLYKDAIKKFEAMRTPPININIDIVNFLEVVECQRDWNKIGLGDYIYIKYERFNVYAKAKIIEIDIDYEERNINLTISNIENIKDHSDLWDSILQKTYSTSTQINMNKFKWDRVEYLEDDVTKLITNAWDAAKQAVVNGVNNSVTIDRRGITVRDPSDPLTFLRIVHGTLAITNDGGNTFKHAITSQGAVKERIRCKILKGLSDNVSI